MLAVSLAGCVSQPVYGPQLTDDTCLGIRIDDVSLGKQLDAAPVMSLKNLSFKPFEPLSTHVIAQDAPVIAVNGYRSRVVSLDFSAHQEDHVYFQLAASGRANPPGLICGGRSFQDTFGIHGMGYRVVLPHILWLDDDKRVLKDTAPEFRALIGGWTLRYERPSGTRYAVFYTQRPKHGEHFTVFFPMAPFVVPGGPVMMSFDNSGRASARTYVMASTGAFGHHMESAVTTTVTATGPNTGKLGQRSPDTLRADQNMPTRVLWDKVAPPR